MWCHTWDFLLLTRDTWGQEDVKKPGVHSYSCKGSPLPYNDSQQVAAVASPVTCTNQQGSASHLVGDCRQLHWSRTLIEPEQVITHPLIIDLWKRSKKICMFSLCLISSTYQGIVDPISSAHCAGTFYCNLTISERKKGLQEGKNGGGWEGTSWVQESCLVLWGALPVCAGFPVGRAQWRAFSLIQCAFYLRRLLADLV